MDGIKVKSLEPHNTEVIKLLKANWGSTNIATRGRLLDASHLPNFVAIDADSKILGLITISIERNECEIVTLDSFVSGIGIGTRLFNEAKNYALKNNCHRLWLITSNDNINAMKFYQKLGMRLVAIHKDAIKEARETIKPEIPLKGEHGIPINDEIEMELLL
jgi:ribosomal protein S18 acetylase RimI-like enzyme